jgi:hypothetical protein
MPMHNTMKAYRRNGGKASVFLILASDGGEKSTSHSAELLVPTD